MVLWSVHQNFNSDFFLDCLQKTLPNGGYVVLDHHRVHMSRQSQTGMRDMNVTPIYLPKRSPDLCPLDFAIWSEVLKRFQKRNAAPLGAGGRQYAAMVKRLTLCGRRLSSDFLLKVTGNFHKRLSSLARSSGARIRE